MNQIVIQNVVTVWTKKSRGGEAARQRNSVPDGLKLPAQQETSRIIYHRAVYSELDRFEEKAQLSSNEKFDDLKLTDLELVEQEAGLAVNFYRDGFNAARRSPFPKIEAFSLAISEWGRLTYNARYTDMYTGQWWYAKSVYNIGLFEKIDRSIFINSKPIRSFSELSNLR